MDPTINNFKKLLTSITKKDFISFVTYTTLIPLLKTTCFECFFIWNWIEVFKN